MLCDFHVHSQFSDGTLTIAQLIDLYGQQGFGAIAITDHLCEEDTFLGRSARMLNRTLTRGNFDQYMQTIRNQAERAWDQYRMIVLPGYEITKNSLNNHRSAHFLAIGVSEFVSADGDVVDGLRQVRGLGGITVAAHPVDTGVWEPQTYHLWSRREELAQEFDAWEVASGREIFTAVQKSPLAKLASSDLHLPHQMTSWKTKLNCEAHPEAILDAIRQQQLEFVFYSEKRQCNSTWTTTNLNRMSVSFHGLPKLLPALANSIIAIKSEA